MLLDGELYVQCGLLCPLYFCAYWISNTYATDQRTNTSADSIGQRHILWYNAQGYESKGNSKTRSREAEGSN
jgi:hypothetical protein